MEKRSWQLLNLGITFATVFGTIFFFQNCGSNQSFSAVSSSTGAQFTNNDGYTLPTVSPSPIVGSPTATPATSPTPSSCAPSCAGPITPVSYRVEKSGFTWKQTSIPQVFGTNEITNVGLSRNGKYAIAGSNAGPSLLSSDGGETWNINSTLRATWFAIAISDDGRKIVGADFQTGLIHTSDDGGATFKPQSGAGKRRIWDSVVLSSDGQKIIASASSEEALTIATSSNFGKSWSFKKLPGEDPDSDAAYKTVASNDLQTIVVLQGGDRLLISSDAGNTWKYVFKRQDHPSNHKISNVAISADGRKIVMILGRDGNVLTSSDQGSTWVDRAQLPATFVANEMAMSGDGNTILVQARSGAVSVSKDGGISWVRQSDAGEFSGKGIGLSQDGSRALLGDWSLSRIISSDLKSPVTSIAASDYAWTQIFDETEDLNSWRSIATSADGKSLLLFGFGSGFYISNDFGVTWNAPPKRLSFGEQSVAMSNSGMQMYSSSRNGVLTSGDQGASWELQTPDQPERVEPKNPNGSRSIAITSDGRFVAMYTEVLAVSRDFGSTWKTLNIPIVPADLSQHGKGITFCENGKTLYLLSREGELVRFDMSTEKFTELPKRGKFGSVACSNDGTRLYVAANDGVDISVDRGSTWKTIKLPVRGLNHIASSANGMTLAVTDTDYGYIYTSKNAGMTWTREFSSGARIWSAIAMTPDGSQIIGVNSTGAVIVARRK